MFDVGVHLDELRSWPTERLVAHHERLVRELRRLQAEDLDVLRVLDERGQIDPTVGRDGESARTLREKLETARGLESLPAIAAAAHAGDLSMEQLAPAVALADEESDAEWARRAPNTSPTELTRLARTRVKPSTEDAEARYAARSLKMWWTASGTMLHLHGVLPDLLGKKFEATINRLTDRSTPVKGQPWDSFEHRAADALVGMCDAVEVAERIETPTLAAKPLLVVEVTNDGSAEIAGIPLADAVVEQLRANASIEPMLVDDDGVPVTIGKRTSGLSPKLIRAILLRDGHCRCGFCDIRYGLQIHHLRPKSWGGSDDPSNLAAVCVPAGHHQKLIPHGPWALVGNPNRPDGLRVVHLNDVTEQEAEQLGLPPPTARPD